MERGYSRVEKRSLIYEWEIDEIISLINSIEGCDNSTIIYSPIFLTGAKIEDSWYLTLRVNEKSQFKN